MQKIITEEQYLEAKRIIEEYQKQIKLQIKIRNSNNLIELLKTKKGDYITYIGGGKSINLIKGNKYRLTCAPWNIRVAVITESGKRKVFKHWLFTV